MLRQLWAFLLRDFRTERTYRIAFLLGFLGIFFSAFTFYFISELVGEAAAPYLAPYGGDYFSFVLIGIAFSGYFGLGLSGFARAVRDAQTTGTLEAMVMTPAPVSVIVVGSALWSYVLTTIRVLIFLAVGAVVFTLNLEGANYAAALLCLLLSIVTFASIGIIAASVIMIIKRGDPITGVFAAFANLLGGIYYPIEVLPAWLQAMARLIPVTYAVRAMRLALLSGASWAELRSDLLILLAFSAALFPASLLVFRLAVERARQDGSLAHY
jgi:ABC-2 type transport system permease protein